MMRVLAAALALAGSLVSGSGLPSQIGLVAAYTTTGSAAVEEPGPPPPPGTEAPADPAPPRNAPPPHRRHIDGDPNIGR